MRCFEALRELPAVADHPVKYASFRQAALTSGFTPVAKRNAEHTNLFALCNDLGLRPRPRWWHSLGVIWLEHVRVNIVCFFEMTIISKSDALLQQVLEIDPTYAPAWSGLAANFANKATNGMVSQQEGYARAREAAEEALAIDPDYAAPHAQLGGIAMYRDNDLAGAARHFQRALTLDPTGVSVLGDAAQFLTSLGRLDEALALEEAILRRDPVNIISLFNLALHQCYAGQYDAAIASFRAVLSLSPSDGGAHAQLEPSKAAPQTVLNQPCGEPGWFSHRDLAALSALQFSLCAVPMTESFHFVIAAWRAKGVQFVAVKYGK